MSDTESSETELDAAIAEYLEAVEAGDAPDRAAFLARHAEVRAGLEEFFADRDGFLANAEQVTAPLLPLAVGERIGYVGDYELLEVVASGGMGVVYRARQTSVGRVVALKMIRAGRFAAPADVQRFRLEAEAAANLDHPNIVPIYEVGDHDGHQYYTMKLIEGGAFLAERRGQPVGGLDEQRRLAGTLAKVARAIHFAHERGILHRDLKPDNILVDRAGEPFVADFGLAKRLEATESISGSGAVVGTACYMAPEQARAEKSLTTAVDVYALGAILYEALTGKPPHLGPGVVDVLRQVCEDEVQSATERGAQIHRDLAAVAHKCLEKKPTARYESAAALADDLERFAAGEPVQARPRTLGQKAYRWFQVNLWSAVAVLAVGVGAGAALAAPGVVDRFGFREVERQTVVDKDGERVRVTLRSTQGGFAWTTAVVVGAAVLAMFAVRPQRRAGDLAVGAAVGLIAVFVYLLAAGGDLLAVNRHWLEWQVQHTKALNATVAGAKVDPQGLQAALDSLRSVKPALSTAVRHVLLTALGYLPVFALASLYMGRIRREFVPLTWWWIGAGIVCLAVSGVAQRTLGDAHPLREFLGSLELGAIVFFYYFWRLIETSPIGLRVFCVATVACVVVYNRTKSYIPADYAEAAASLPLAALLTIAVVAALVDRALEEEPAEADAVGQDSNLSDKA